MRIPWFWYRATTTTKMGTGNTKKGSVANRETRINKSIKFCDFSGCCRFFFSTLCCCVFFFWIRFDPWRSSVFVCALWFPMVCMLPFFFFLSIDCRENILRVHFFFGRSEYYQRARSAFFPGIANISDRINFDKSQSSIPN